MELKRKKSFYERHVKRFLDVICSIIAIIVFCWLYAILAILVKIKLGSPVIFKQPRPGMIDPKTGRERIFNLYKFRSMTDERDENGNLHPDEKRLTKFGKMLRATSLDELPEVFNILKGDMSFIGPRPQLIQDLVFMDEKARLRHTAKPGLSGLAQINGRNAVSWEQKFEWDLKYVGSINFILDLSIVFFTLKKVLGRSESSAELEVTDDYGDSLLKSGKINKEEYDSLHAKAKEMIAELEETRK